MVTYTYIDLKTGEPAEAGCEDDVRDALVGYILTEDDIAEQLGVSAEVFALWEREVWWEMMMAKDASALTNDRLARHFIAEAEDFFGGLA